MPWYETFDFRKEAIVDKFYGRDILEEYCYDDANANMVAFENYIMGMRKEIDMNKKSYEIEKVIFNDPATIILWKDGTKTVVKCCEFDSYDPYVGVSMAINKKLLGDDYKRVFKKALSFCENEDEYTPDFTKEWAKHITRIKEGMTRLSQYCEEEPTTSIGIVPVDADTTLTTSVENLKAKINELKSSFSALDLGGKK